MLQSPLKAGSTLLMNSVYFFRINGENNKSQPQWAVTPDIGLCVEA